MGPIDLAVGGIGDRTPTVLAQCHTPTIYATQECREK